MPLGCIGVRMLVRESAVGRNPASCVSDGLALATEIIASIVGGTIALNSPSHGTNNL